MIYGFVRTITKPHNLNEHMNQQVEKTFIKVNVLYILLCFARKN